MKFSNIIILISLIFNSAIAHEWDGSRADGHAPIGVMGEHIHKKNEWMLSYRYMEMEMKGNRSGGDRISEADVLNTYMVAPVDMSMRMHMFGAMYASSDKITWMAMVPVKEMSMNHVMRNGNRFQTETDGLGDIKLSALIALKESHKTKWHFNLGLSFPTGAIDERGATPMNANMKLPYPMQLGSGTYDLLPGLTYLGQKKSYSWGAQVMGNVPLGKNGNNYKLGNQLQYTQWFAKSWTRDFSSALRLRYKSWQNITGSDSELNVAMVPTADGSKRGGERIDLGLSLNATQTKGPLRGNRLAVEYLVPVFQDLEGPQLELDWELVAGYQIAF